MSHRLSIQEITHVPLGTDSGRLIITYWLHYNAQTNNYPWTYITTSCGFRSMCGQWIIMVPNEQHPLHDNYIWELGAYTFVWDYDGAYGLDPTDFTNQFSYLVALALWDNGCDDITTTTTSAPPTTSSPPPPTTSSTTTTGPPTTTTSTTFTTSSTWTPPPPTTTSTYTNPPPPELLLKGWTAFDRIQDGPKVWGDESLAQAGESSDPPITHNDRLQEELTFRAEPTSDLPELRVGKLFKTHNFDTTSIDRSYFAPIKDESKKLSIQNTTDSFKGGVPTGGKSPYVNSLARGPVTARTPRTFQELTSKRYNIQNAMRGGTLNFPVNNHILSWIKKGKVSVNEFVGSTFDGKTTSTKAANALSIDSNGNVYINPGLNTLVNKMLSNYLKVQPKIPTTIFNELELGSRVYQFSPATSQVKSYYGSQMATFPNGSEFPANPTLRIGKGKKPKVALTNFPAALPSGISAPNYDNIGDEGGLNEEFTSRLLAIALRHNSGNLAVEALVIPSTEVATSTQNYTLELWAIKRSTTASESSHVYLLDTDGPRIPDRMFAIIGNFSITPSGEWKIISRLKRGSTQIKQSVSTVELSDRQSSIDGSSISATNKLDSPPSSVSIARVFSGPGSGIDDHIVLYLEPSTRVTQVGRVAGGGVSGVSTVPSIIAVVNPKPDSSSITNLGAMVINRTDNSKLHVLKMINTTTEKVIDRNVGFLKSDSLGFAGNTRSYGGAIFKKTRDVASDTIIRIPISTLGGNSWHAVRVLLTPHLRVYNEDDITLALSAGTLIINGLVYYGNADLQIYPSGGKNLIPRTPVITEVMTDSVGSFTATINNMYRGFWVGIAIKSSKDSLGTRTFIWKEIK